MITILFKLTTSFYFCSNLDMDLNQNSHLHYLGWSIV